MVRNAVDGEILQVYLGSSPKSLCPYSRSDDLTILTEAINQAEVFIFVAVADYAPFNQFGKLHSWTILQDLLLSAQKRGLKIRMILSKDKINISFSHLKYVIFMQVNELTPTKIGENIF